jgi:hypothetical protein
MPPKRAKNQNLERLRHPPSVPVPGTEMRINLPDRPAVAWYAGIGAMAAIELIEWPVALLITGTHFIENHARSRSIEELCDGIDAGA